MLQPRISILNVITKYFKRRKNNKLIKYLHQYADNISYAKKILREESYKVEDLGFELRSRVSRNYISKAVWCLEKVGYDNPSSIGYNLYEKTVLANAELITPASEETLMNCLNLIEKPVLMSRNKKSI